MQLDSVTSRRQDAAEKSRNQAAFSLNQPRTLQAVVDDAIASYRKTVADMAAKMEGNAE